jgi:hypothetical protein
VNRDTGRKELSDKSVISDNNGRTEIGGDKSVRRDSVKAG